MKRLVLVLMVLAAACLIPAAPEVASYGWRSDLYLSPDTVRLAPGDSVEIYGYYLKPNGDTLPVLSTDLFFILHEGGDIYGYEERFYVAGDTACTGWGGCRVWAEDRSRNKDYPPVGEMIVVIEVPAP